MTHLERLDAQISRARCFFREKSNLDYLASAREIIDASGHCGQGVTLNENQTRALALYLEGESALREVRARNWQPATNIIRFSRN